MTGGGLPGHGWTVVLRRMPIRIVAGRQEGGYTDAFEIVCCDCGDDPGGIDSPDAVGLRVGDVEVATTVHCDPLWICQPHHHRVQAAADHIDLAGEPSPRERIEADARIRAAVVAESDARAGPELK